MTVDPLIPAIEACCLRAWPALREGAVDGWRLRFSAGYTRRANSVQPWRGGAGATAAPAAADSLAARIARCEAAYAGLGQPCVFKVSPLVDPPDLDARLAAAGYRREGETSVQVLDALPEGPPLDGDSRLVPTRELVAPDGDWLAVFHGIDATPAVHRPTLRAILAAIDVPHAGALLRAGDADVACGRAVLTEARVGLYDIATHPAHRR